MRYIRQEQLKFIPKNFQKNIENKKIVLIGCGGIGSPLAELLVRGGFLNLTLIDYDKIDKTNLNRQIYFEKDIGRKKSFVLRDYLLEINENAKINVIGNEVNENNINNFCFDANLIIDATDNFEIRKLINKFSLENKKDWLYNGAVKTEVISCLFYFKENLFKKVFNSKIKNEKASDVGILPSTTFLSASLAFNQILKYFLNIKENKLIKLNLWTNQLFEVNLK